MSDTRIYYVGDDMSPEPALPGVIIRPNVAVDTNAEIAERLVNSGTWSYDPPGTATVEPLLEIAEPEGKDTKPLMEITDESEGVIEWFDPQSEPLETLPDLGEKKADSLRGLGVENVGDLAQADDDLLTQIANEVNGISLSKLEHWRSIAQGRVD